MKKALRILCLITVTVIVCLSLSGCTLIDEMRDAHAFWSKDNTIKYGEYEYKLLPASETLKPVFNAYNSVYVTDEEVPVLLSSSFGQNYYVSDDGIFLFTDMEDGYICYCRNDRYDEILQKITNGFEPESYCYSYYDYENTEDTYYVFSETEVEAVNNVVKSVIPTVMPEAATLDYDYIVSIEACSKDLFFRTYIADICITDNKYYVVVTEDENTLLYQVSGELQETFEKIMKAAVDSEKQLHNSFSDFEDY